MPIDDLGTFVALSRAPRRVVSLVPSLTEAIAASAPDVLVGATDWCSHPADLDVPRVRGTKNPDLAAIARLRPDLVVANREENRELDVRRLRQAGLPVWVTVIESLAQALDSMDRLFAEALAAPRPKWLAQARQAWSSPVLCGDDEGPVVVVPIWRDPWMVVGSRTFTGDVLTVWAPGTPSASQQTDTRMWTWPRSTARTSTWRCCRTSPTGSRPRTVRRRSSTCSPGWSAGGC